MRHIDEALKRAAGIAIPSEGAQRSAHQAEPARLDHYPAEMRERIAGMGSPSPPAPPLTPVPLSDTAAASAAAVAPSNNNARARNTSLDPVFSEKLVTQLAPAVGEQYRRLAAALHELQVERGLKMIVLTSAIPQDGKTLTAVNLALTLSQSYARRVLLIDADLRRPRVHEALGLPNTAGLVDALTAPSFELPLIDVGSTLLSVMPAGHPDQNPLAGLSSERMRAVLDECAPQYDWVLLDAPPVGVVPDAQLLGRLVGAVILVIRAGHTPFAAVERAVADLGRECIVGTVLNGAEADAIAARHYYHYYPTKLSSVS